MKKSTRSVLEFIVQHVQTPEEIDLFFSALLTPKEYTDLLDRVRICQELSTGATVLQVCKKLNVGYQRCNKNYWNVTSVEEVKRPSDAISSYPSEAQWNFNFH